MGKKIANKVGIVSGVLIIVLTVLFSLFFSMYMSKMPAQWTGIEEYIKSYNHGLFVGWVLPCLLLALIYPVFMFSIYDTISEEKKFICGIGLIFGVMYGAILTANYFVLMHVVRPSIFSGIIDGLHWFVIGSPNSITYALGGAGYGLLGLAMLCLGFSFGSKLTKGMYIASGVGGILGVIGGLFGSSLVAMISLGIWSLVSPIAIVLTVMYFMGEKVQNIENAEDVSEAKRNE